MSNIITSFNKLTDYIEEHLTDTIDYQEMEKITGYSSYHLQRLFLMISNTPISEYIRYRRLSCAAYDLLDQKQSVTDIALKYGYSSPASFNRAFKAFHNVNPKDIKKQEHFIKAYPPLSFELTIRGAVSLDYRMMETDTFRIIGKKIHTTMESGQSYQDIPAFWQTLQTSQAIPPLLASMNQVPFGLLGVSDYNPDLSESTFDYYIGVSSDLPLPPNCEELTIEKTTWACFKRPMGDPLELQNFQKNIIFDWLPTSGFEFAVGPDLEVYGQDNEVEVWLPVSRIIK